MTQAQSFDKVAELYAEVRRGYPAQLFEDLRALAGLGPAANVLEIGCGSGQATGDLAARARHVTALDPGAQLIEQARARIANLNVDYVVAKFENYAVASGAFDLVASAQAWHWVAPNIGFPKLANALKLGGTFAVFGHVPMALPEPFNSAFRPIVERHWPGAWGSPPPQAYYLQTGPVAAIIAASGLFGPVTHRAYSWTWTLDPGLLGRYLRTDSSYHALVEAERFAMFDAMSAAVADLGGQLQAPWETHLYVARRV